MPKNKNSYQKSVQSLVGILLLVLGMTLILLWWRDVVSLFRAGLALMAALGGLVILYSLSQPPK